MQPILHIVFGEAGATRLREALGALGREDSVAEFADDLSFGPIASADPAIRAAWVADNLAEDDWRELVPFVEQFWTDALSSDACHVVWFSRRVTRDYTGFLDYVTRIGDRPCYVVDLTEVNISYRDRRAGVSRVRRAMTPGFLDAQEIIENDLISRAVPLTLEERRVFQDDWRRLQGENAPLRIIDPDLKLTSVPITHFDNDLLKYVQPHFLKAARIVGDVMGRQEDIYHVGDFFLSCRLLALAEAGMIEAVGNLKHIRFSEVRLPVSASA